MTLSILKSILVNGVVSPWYLATRSYRCKRHSNSFPTRLNTSMIWTYLCTLPYVYLSLVLLDNIIIVSNHLKNLSLYRKGLLITFIPTFIGQAQIVSQRESYFSSSWTSASRASLLNRAFVDYLAYLIDGGWPNTWDKYGRNAQDNARSQGGAQGVEESTPSSPIYFLFLPTTLWQ